MSVKLPIDVVKSKLNNIFGGCFTFPYLDKEYKDSKSRVTLICPIHGETTKILNSLMHKNNGCTGCKPLRRTMDAFFGKRVSNEDMSSFYSYVTSKQPLPDETFTNKHKFTQLLKQYHRSIMNF